MSPITKTFMVGDSLTMYGAPYLAALEPTGWTIDGQGGRTVPQGIVPCLDYLDTHRNPDRFVIALGANEEYATKQKYQDMVDLVGPKTLVMMVLPYRDADLWGVERAAAVAQCATWMREIVHARPNSCMAKWPAFASSHPDLLVDGVHQTDPDGCQAWAQLVSDQLALGPE